MGNIIFTSWCVLGKLYFCRGTFFSTDKCLGFFFKFWDLQGPRMHDAFLEGKRKYISKRELWKRELRPCCVKLDSSEFFSLHQKWKQPCTYKSIVVLPFYGNWLVALSICYFSKRQKWQQVAVFTDSVLWVVYPCPVSHTTFLFSGLKENIKPNPVFHISLIFKPPPFCHRKASCWSVKLPPLALIRDLGYISYGYFLLCVH